MGRGTDHALWLRGLLKAERVRRGWSLQETANRVARELDKPSLSKQSLQDWEEFKTQPKIDAFAAWARVFGLRLEVDLVTPTDGSIAVRVPEHLADVVRALVALRARDRQVVIDMISTLESRTS